MFISDFTKIHYSFKGQTCLWGNPDAYIRVHHDRHEGQEYEFLSSILEIINKKLEWIENNRAFLETVLIENDIIGATEEWIQKSNDAEKIEDGVYALNDGITVSLPLERESFLSGLFISGVIMTFDPDEQKPDTDLFIHCKPDYFINNACIQVEINYDNSIKECIILSQYSPDKPWD